MPLMIGRKHEQEDLAEYCRSRRAELICVYGRRRVGKTHLVQNTFQQRMAFSATASEDRRMKTQLRVFHEALRIHGLDGRAMPTDWFEEAFGKRQPQKGFRRPREVRPCSQIPHNPGAQIDLVIERADGVSNLCEMKCTGSAFVIDKSYELDLRRKREVFRSETRTKNATQPTMVCAQGLQHNTHSWDVASTVSGEDLLAF